MEKKWETVSDGVLYVERLRIPRTGWLVHSMDKANNLFSSCFVPDDSKQWDLNE